MILVFCDTSDLPALWAAGRLAARGLAVDIVTAQVLESALKWHHEISGRRRSARDDRARRRPQDLSTFRWRC